jgi:acetyltransferase-like isoleucine patch superfamily enzyme
MSMLQDQASRLSLLHVGEYTIGMPINVKYWGDPASNYKIHIGKFCAISDNITIYTGGNHPLHLASIFNFNAVYRNGSNDGAESKGDVHIENDVWIGSGATIMSGVTIGDGAVIGACSVVAKNIPAYAIVVGNPAQIKRYRCTVEEIAFLEKIQWWNWPIDQILSKVAGKTIKELMAMQL